jgi:hypothetical protein
MRPQTHQPSWPCHSSCRTHRGLRLNRRNAGLKQRSRPPSSGSAASRAFRTVLEWIAARREIPSRRLSQVCATSAAVFRSPAPGGISQRPQRGPACPRFPSRKSLRRCAARRRCSAEGSRFLGRLIAPPAIPPRPRRARNRVGRRRQSAGAVRLSVVGSDPKPVNLEDAARRQPSVSSLGRLDRRQICLLYSSDFLVSAQQDGTISEQSSQA